MLGCNFARDVRPRVAGADEEDRPGPKLARIPILARVQLPDPWIELACDVRHERQMLRSGRDDDVARREAPVARRYDIAGLPVAGAAQALDGNPVPHRQLEACRVCLQVRGHLVPGRERVWRQRERHFRKSVAARRREQA